LAIAERSVLRVSADFESTAVAADNRR